MGRFLASGYHRVFFMDNGNQADRVDQYLAWRTVNALETIAFVMDYFYRVFLWACLVYLFIYYVWPKGKTNE